MTHQTVILIIKNIFTFCYLGLLAEALQNKRYETWLRCWLHGLYVVFCTKCRSIKFGARNMLVFFLNLKKMKKCNQIPNSNCICIVENLSSFVRRLGGKMCPYSVGMLTRSIVVWLNLLYHKDPQFVVWCGHCNHTIIFAYELVL